MSADFLLYGANGYTGRLIIEHSLTRGVRPCLAGRDRAAIEALARRYGLENRVFGLDAGAEIDAGLQGVAVVLNAAGPFSRTALPLAEACIRAGTHYVDITGEIGVFEALHARGRDAEDAHVVLLPGAGFDVVPTDLLAAHLKRRLPSATQLRLAFHARGGAISRGTLTTMIENVERGGAVRRGGRIVRVPAAWRTREIDFGFGSGPVQATTIPWGDVATAYYSTGIPDIEVYARSTRAQRIGLTLSRRAGRLLGAEPVQRALKAWVRRRVTGPDEARRMRSDSLIWGEALDESGARVESRMRTPEGYTLTAMTSVEIVQRILGGEARAGYQTPSLAFGADWILELNGVERVDS